MNATDLEKMLYDLLYDPELADTVDAIQTYEEAGTMTRDRGLALRTGDGSEFHITIIQTR